MSDLNWCLEGSRYGLVGNVDPPTTTDVSAFRCNCLTRGKRLVVEGEDPFHILVDNPLDSAFLP